MSRKLLTEKGQKVLASRIYKEETVPQQFSYFTANNEFILFIRDKSGYEKIVDIVPDIRYTNNDDKAHYFVFQTWNAFNYYEIFNSEIVQKSTNQTIKSIQKKYLDIIEIIEVRNQSFRINHYNAVGMISNTALFSPKEDTIIEMKWLE